MESTPTPGYCAAHNRKYGKLEQCPQCRHEAMSGKHVGAPKADTLSLRVKAAEYRLREYACWAAFETALAYDPHVAVKLSDQSGKWAGRADELEMRLLELEHDQWLIEQDRERRSGGN